MEILLEYKEQEHRKMLKEATFFENKLNDFCVAVSTRSGLAFTNTLLQKVIDGGDQQPIIDAITRIITNQLSQAGVSIASIRDSAVKVEIQEYQRLHTELMKAKATFLQVNSFMNAYSIVEGKPTLSKTFAEDTKDQFCRKLKTTKGIAGYEKATQAVSLLNEALKDVHPTFLINAGVCIDYDRQAKKFVVNDKNFDFDFATSDPPKL
ncbi:hypothetical protein ABDK00_013215 [Niabella insulamsoli]|uniref:hypothetical protein n=1 Tax=Niabella insulamsoli TaxID=3144874 RepID=UPI0031FD9DFC